MTGAIAANEGNGLSCICLAISICHGTAVVAYIRENLLDSQVEVGRPSTHARVMTVEVTSSPQHTWKASGKSASSMTALKPPRRKSCFVMCARSV